MQPTWGARAEQYREKVQAFLAETLPADWEGIGALPHDEVMPWWERWRRTLADNGLLATSWPEEYGGGGLTAEEQVIPAEEFARAGVPTGGMNDVFSIQMVGNTILEWGTEEQKQEFIPKILSGEHVWCQGYSEPNAGSDLGNLGCRTVLDGDEWVINGQKIWTSAGHPEAGLFKLFWSEYHQRSTELALDLFGVDATVPTGRAPISSFQTDDPGAPNDSASWVGTFMNARAGTIYAGSSQIQKNIIGEMVLGLPKEPRATEPGTTWREQQAR